jgi:polar amino acid transport system substrate-binding protein
MLAVMRRALAALLLLAGAAAAQSIGSSTSDPPPSASRNNVLRGGWYPWDPYQYLDYSWGAPFLTGFDVEIERAIERIMGVELALPQRAWEDHLAALAEGTADIAAGATWSEARSRYAYFSKPYRTETDVLILPRGTSGRFSFKTVDEMLATFAKQKFRLGVIAGFVYADPRINAFIADPANRGQIVTVGNDGQNLDNLLTGVIDGFLADRIAATTTAWRRKQSFRIEEHPLRVTADIRFMLSRATQTEERLASLNQAIDKATESGELHRIARTYVMPALINQTLDSEWFRILVFIGTVAFALSGVLLAHEGRYTLFGALVLAVLPAVGGGIVRDLLLQRTPIGVVRDPEALLVVFGTVMAGMIIIALASRLQALPSTKRLILPSAVVSRSIETLDAIGLAAFTVTGVVVVMDTGAQPLWLWGPIAAVITSSFGGLMRDLFRDDRVIANLRGELYAEIAGIWGLAFALFLDWEGGRLESEEIGLGVIVTIVGAFTTRMLAIAYRAKGWRYS